MQRPFSPSIAATSNGCVYVGFVFHGAATSVLEMERLMHENRGSWAVLECGEGLHENYRTGSAAGTI